MNVRHISLPVCVFLLAWRVQAAEQGLPGDAEAAAHGDEAARVQLVEETEDVRNLDGGSEAWIEAGLPTLGAGDHDSATSAAVPAGVFVNLPEPISPDDLMRRLLDLPETFELVDIRPAAQFAEYSLPNSVNAPVGQVLGGQAYAGDRRPLILVCRDGYLSASVAGVLTQKLNRPIRYLVGGVSRYHDEIARPGGIYSDFVPMPPKSASPAPAASTPSTPPPPAAPRRRSAGC